MGGRKSPSQVLMETKELDDVAGTLEEFLRVQVCPPAMRGQSDD